MNVDPIAGLYRWIEYAAFGRALERARFAFLDWIADDSRLLMLGEGDGRYLARVLRMNRSAHIDVIEASNRMISLAARRTEHDAARVSFIQSNALETDLPPSAYDAVITNFFLDCFSHADVWRLSARVAAAIKPGGVWIVSEFQQPPTGLPRWHARLWLWAMYTFFGLTTRLQTRELPPYIGLLEREGLQLVAEQRRRLGLIVSQVWSKPVES